MSRQIVNLFRERARNINEGHPWIFSGAIKEKPKKLEDGEIVNIYIDKDFIGIGYFSKNTDIAIRILTREREEIDTDFFIKKFQKIKEVKESFVKNTNSYRLVYGESDDIPGLIIDKYDNTYVLQYHSIGIEKLKKEIIEALVKVCKPECIYEKDVLHNKSGLKSLSSVVYGTLPEKLIIEENGFLFYVDVEKGQKTGFFLDQRENRKSILEYTKDRNVLNMFCYTGGFSVYAAKNAKTVTSVDISKGAVEQAAKNFELNKLNLKNHAFVADDAFEFLKNMKKGDFDFIILDPPSMARNRAQIPNAIKAYTTLNSKALEKLPDNGILVTSSCTAKLDELTFIKIINQSAINAKCHLKVLHSATQPFDHAYNIGFPEGKYLKFFILYKY